MDPWTYLATAPRVRTPSDPFFADGDAVCGMRTCAYLTQDDDERLLHPDYPDFPCPDCPETFRQLIDFETHYATMHRHECGQPHCRRSFPSAHLLELHLSETHDSFFAALSAKKPSFGCFLQKCGEKFWTAEERKSHCVRKHEFNLDNADAPLKKASSLSPKLKKLPRKRPKSVFMSTPKLHHQHSPVKSRIPTPVKSHSQSKANLVERRRFSLAIITGGAKKDTEKGLAEDPDDEPKSAPIETTPRRRVSLSLARMGERLSQSRASLSSSSNVSSPSPSNSQGIGINSSSGSSSKCNSGTNSTEQIRSRIPVFKRSFSCKIPSQSPGYRYRTGVDQPMDQDQISDEARFNHSIANLRDALPKF